jgi:eukaryotic-like serine/threonine-protein kinase
MLLMVAVTAQSIVGSLLAGRLRSPGPLALLALLVGLTLLVPLITTWQGSLSQRVRNVPIEPGMDARSRTRMLRLVRMRARDQVDQALHHVVPLELRLDLRSDLVEFPADRLVRTPDDHMDQPTPAGQPVLATFDQLAQAMLIVGAPGAGKTTLLNELALHLVARAERDSTQPIPIVVNLASWANRRAPMEVWLGDELNVAYGVHPRLGRAAATAGVFLPLLDGLDELPDVDRAKCVAAINAYQDIRARPDRQLAPIVVCSRLMEAETLTTRLRMVGAVRLRPPNDQQVTAYLEAVGASEILTAARADHELWEFLYSPLILSIVALTTSNRAVTALREPADLRLAALLDAYVDTMLTPPDSGGRRRAALAAWPPDRVRAWLAWLAALMTRHSLTEFYLERLQPSWLDKPAYRWLVRLTPAACSALLIALIGRLTSQQTGHAGNGVIIVLVSGPAVILATLASGRKVEPAGTLEWPRHRRVRLPFSVGRGLLFGGILGGLLGVIETISGDATGNPILSYGQAGLAAGAVAGVLSGPFGAAGCLLSGVLVGVVTAILTHNTDIGLGIGLLAVLLGGLALGLREVQRGLLLGGLIGAAIGAVFAVAVANVDAWRVVIAGGLVGGLAGGLLGSLLSMLGTGIDRLGTRPNQGIHRSIRQAILVGGLAGTVLGGLFWIIGDPNDVVMGTAGGLAGLLFGGLAYGGNAALQHCALRVLAIRLGVTPKRLVRFLDAATDSLLLRRVGGGYRFPHQQLQSRFAAYAITTSVASNSSKLVHRHPN